MHLIDTQNATAYRWMPDIRLWSMRADTWGYEGDWCLAVVDDFGDFQPVALIPVRRRSQIHHAATTAVSSSTNTTKYNASFAW